MNRLKSKVTDILEQIRNPAPEERAYKKDLNFKRLLFLAPFIIAAAIFLLLSLDN